MEQYGDFGRIVYCVAHVHIHEPQTKMGLSIRQVSMALRRLLLILFSQFILIREASNFILACLILSHLLPSMFVLFVMLVLSTLKLCLHLDNTSRHIQINPA